MRLLFLACLIVAASSAKPVTAQESSLEHVPGAIVSIRWEDSKPYPPARSSQLLLEDAKRLRLHVEQLNRNAGGGDEPARRRYLYRTDNQPAVVKQAMRASGFYVGERIVTILDPGARQKELLVVAADGAERKVRPTAWDTTSGVVILEHAEEDKAEHTELLIAESEPRWGEPIRIAHDWKPKHPALLSGIVSSTPYFEASMRTTILDLDVAVPHESVGAPVLNQSGKVIAIVKARRAAPGAAGRGIAVASAAVNRVLKYAQDGNRGALPKAMLGVVLMPSEEGATVAQIMEESSAKEAGIKAGDVIVSLNDQVTANPDELIRAVDQLAPGDSVEIKIKRDGDQQSLKLSVSERKQPEPSQQRVTVLSGGPFGGNYPQHLYVFPGTENAERFTKKQREEIENAIKLLRRQLEDDGAYRPQVIAVPKDVNQQIDALKREIQELKAELEKARSE